MAVDENTMVILLCVQSLLLSSEDECRTCNKYNNKCYEPRYETYQAVAEDEAENSATHGSCCPVDIPTLDSHKFKRPLKSLEQWVVRIVLFFCHINEIS